LVIGDRLFSLPIQVEGFELNGIHATQMDIDDGNLGGGHNMEGREDGSSTNNASQGKGKNADSSSPSQLNSMSSNTKQLDDTHAGEKNLEGIHAAVPEKGEINNVHNDGNFMNLNQNFIVDNAYTSILGNHEHFLRAACEKHKIIGTVISKQSHDGTLANEASLEVGGIMHDVAQGAVNERGISLLSHFSTTGHQNGNSLLNLNQSSQEVSDAMHMIDDRIHSPSSHAALGIQQAATLGFPQVMKNGGSKGGEGKLFVLENTAAKTVKRRKHREGSVDEDSSARAKWLKAKKNLDGPDTSKSKSFLSFSHSKIVNNIATLGVSIGNDIEKSTEDMKEVELNRLLQASNSEPKHKDTCQLFDDETE
jgi:hypothetical protein